MVRRPEPPWAGGLNRQVRRPEPPGPVVASHRSELRAQLFSCEHLRDAAVLASSYVTQLFWCEQLRDATVRSYVTLLSLDFDFASLACLDALFAILKCNTMLIATFLGPVDLGKARAGGSSTDASAFWDLLDPPMRSRVVATGFGNYASGLHRTQPRFPPAMHYALMERWNDCTNSFIFGFGEMTLTPTDFIAITSLGFDGEAVPLDARYQTAALGVELVGTLLGVPTRTRYTAQGYVSYEVVYKFWAERILTRLAAWRELPADARPATPAYTREERDQAARSYDWASLTLAHLYHGLDVWTRGSGESNWQFLRPLEVWAYEYRIYPGGLESDTSTEARALADLFLSPWEGDAWEAYPPRALAEALTRSRVLLHGYWVDRYFLGERVLEIRVATAHRRVPAAPPRHMCILEGMTPEDRLLEYDGFPADAYLIPGDYASYLTTRLQARLPAERRRHRTPAFYRAQAEADAPTGPTGAVLVDVPFPPGMEVALDPTLGLGPAIAIPVDLRQAPPQLQLDPEHATHIHPMNQLVWLKYFKDLKLDHSFLSWLVMYFNPNTMVFQFEDSEVTPTYEEMCAVMSHHPEQDETPALPPGPRYDLTEVAALCPVYLPDGIDSDQGLPLEPFLTRVLSMDANPSWVLGLLFPIAEYSGGSVNTIGSGLPEEVVLAEAEWEERMCAMLNIWDDCVSDEEEKMPVKIEIEKSITVKVADVPEDEDEQL
ncbi:hypothetical protein JCGZ_15000 [Jatropha curcas]|uniref:Uncharacterized protein n=1 Tax=Jatropha curcas TaxID=180498 RepID=A0A067K685_JATCU|nr:hypothetical protein JCGZ_15000 [Jatropha curcas]